MSSSTIDTCYNLWLAIPVPSLQHLSQLRQEISNSSVSSLSGPPLSLELIYASHTIRLPLWSLNLWPTLRSLIACCQAWDSARHRLIDLAATNCYREKAVHFLDRLTQLPVNAEILDLAQFRTAYIPNLLCDSWLSDDHINAGVQFINTHAQCQPNLQVLDSFFPVHLERCFERSSSWSPRHPAPLDSLVASQKITQLLIPIHRPSHWTLLHVNIHTKCYAYADTLDLTTAQAPWPLIDLINRWLTSLLGIPTILITSAWPFPLSQQLDNHSCGVAVLSTMANYALGDPFGPWTQSTTLEHRLNWSLYFSAPLTSPKVSFQVI
jgi:hypothetical protein